MNIVARHNHKMEIKILDSNDLLRIFSFPIFFPCELKILIKRKHWKDESAPFAKYTNAKCWKMRWYFYR